MSWNLIPKLHRSNPALQCVSCLLFRDTTYYRRNIPQARLSYCTRSVPPIRWTWNSSISPLAIYSLLTGHRGPYGHLPRIGKDINPLCRSFLNGKGTVEHVLCEREPLTISRGRIFWQSFGELQLSHVPVDLFGRFATEIGLAGK